MKKTLAVIALTIAIAWLTPSLGADTRWLIGKWELTHDPDGNDKDWVEFLPDGHAVNTSPDGRRTAGQYAASESQVTVVYSSNGRSISIMLKYSPDKKKLLAYSKKTGNTAEYQKVK